MTAKEIKTRLKEAREAIRLKDFQGAVAHCKAVLEMEKTNYNALVFLGVSCEGLDQIDQALDAYKKATSECPDQLLAWQGMGSMLDKNPHVLDIKERIRVFENILSLTTGNEGKRISYLHKLVSLYKEANNENQAYDTLKELLEFEKEGDGRVSSCQLMVDLLRSQDLSQDEMKYDQYCECLKELLECPTMTDDDVNKYTTLSLILKSKMGKEALSVAWKELRHKFPQATPPLEFGLQIHLEQAIAEVEVTQDVLEAVKDVCNDLKILSPDNEMVNTTLGFLALYENNFAQARDYLIYVPSTIISAQYYLGQAYLKLHDPKNCLKACSTAVAQSGSVTCCSVDEILDKLKLMQAEAHRQMGSEEDQEVTLTILEQVQDRRPNEALIIKSQLYVDQGRLNDAQVGIQSLSQDDTQVKILTAIIYMAQKQFKKALDILHGVLSQEQDNATATLKKGIILWELRDSPEIENAKQQCFTVLLKAAKLDPYNYEGFLYLGYFYEQVQKDLNKAIRCYKKSYDLNPTSDDAGCALVDALVDQEDQSQAVDILNSVTSRSPAGKAKWAWLRLGLYQLKHEDPSTAITSFQSALRADPKDNHVWECLSEAYLHRGSLTAALKAFTKASELNPESTYCFYQIASIKQTLGLLSDAVTEYKHVLEKDSTYVAALKGLGETLIQMAKQNLDQCLDGLAQDNIEEALAVLARAASHRPDFSCVWKLMGDACTLVSCLTSNSYRISSKLSDKSSASQKMTQVTKEHLLQIGGRCYSQAVKIMPENASLWHNLGVNLYRQSCLQHQDPQNETASELLHRARKSLENALKLDPQNWRHWNALGVMACSKADSKLPFAQHCFIKSIECEANNVAAWSNLGILYLSEGNIELAHDAFKAAQRLDPTFLVGWLGQALVAETVGHEEAMDLFRHTTELGSHLESQLGYGHQVLTMLRDETKQNTELFHFCIHKMAAIPAASDALIKYTVRVQNDPIAYNMLGLLLEHQNLIRPSVEAFEKALKLLEENDEKGIKNQVRVNYARALCTFGQYKESLEQFQLLGSDLTVEHLFVYALTAYKDGQYIESFKLYKLALDQMSDSDSRKSQVFAALALVAFKVEDLEEAKTQLFNGFQTDCPSLHGLLAMCALGLHQRDMTLTTAALEELNKRTDTDTVVEKIAVLSLYKHVLEASVPEGESSLTDLIQSCSQNTRKLYAVLTCFLLNNFSHRGPDVLEHLKTINEENGNLNLSEIVTKAMAQLQSGQHNHFNNGENPLKTAQRAFHQNPGDVSAIAALACSVHVEGVLRKASVGHTCLFQTEKSLLSMLESMEFGEKKNNPHLLIWHAQQLAVCCAELGEEAEAQQLLHVLKEEGSVADFVEAMTLFLYATQIDEWKKKENMLSIQVVCALLAEEENELSVINMLKDIVEKPAGNQANLPVDRLLELWTMIAFKDMQKKKVTGSKEFESLFGQAIALSETKEIKSPVVSILQGVRTLKRDKKQAKHYFATALDRSEGKSDISNCRSLARQGLLSLLWDSTKESDVQLIQALIIDADSELDEETVNLYNKLSKK